MEWLIVLAVVVVGMVVLGTVLARRGRAASHIAPGERSAEGEIIGSLHTPAPGPLGAPERPMGAGSNF